MQQQAFIVGPLKRRTARRLIEESGLIWDEDWTLFYSTFHLIGELYRLNTLTWFLQRHGCINRQY